jgi:cholest-4-en-3-one 26-monooxygenase
MATTEARPTFDLLDPAFYGDIDAMHDAFTWMRADAPVYRDEANGLWGITRHADVIDVERRAQVFVSGRGYRSFHSPGETNMIAQDDPEHAEQRRLVSRRFTPGGVRELEPLIRSLVSELVDGAVERGGMDVVADLAAQLPARLTAHLLGYPEERWPAIQSWSERLMRYDAVPRDQDAMQGMLAAIMEFRGELDVLAEERRRQPADDLISVWANAEVGGCPMTADTIMHETGLFISGGAETTRTVIARSLREFCRHPDQWELLAAEPARIPTAVEEMIRWVTPLNNFFRTAVTDASVRGVAMATGDRVILLYPSANRDEDVFDDPFTFDVTRDPNHHAAFGFGPHFCLGAPLARLELRILMEELTRRVTNLRVRTEPDIEPNVFVGAVRSFELDLDAR